MDLRGYLQLTPQLHHRVWGGRRLGPGTPPIGEAWVIHEHNRVSAGIGAGRTLGELAAEYGSALLGRRVSAATGDRFPILVKLLDTADWLSVQVHPNDEQARALEGPGERGKTEAWYILEADPEARVILGVRPGTPPDDVRAGIRAGNPLDLLQRVPVAAGDSLFVPAGAIHALGPGLLLYEVQQTSDLTYRVFDWNRPPTNGRQLHVEKSLAVVDPTFTGRVAGPPPAVTDPARLLDCAYFCLDRVRIGQDAAVLDPAGETFHALTAIDGSAEIAGDGWSGSIDPFGSVVIPATAGPYQVRAADGACLLVSSVGGVAGAVGTTGAATERRW